MISIKYILLMEFVFSRKRTRKDYNHSVNL